MSRPNKKKTDGGSRGCKVVLGFGFPNLVAGGVREEGKQTCLLEKRGGG